MGIVNRVGVLYAPHTALLYLNLGTRSVAWHRSIAPLTMPSSIGEDMDPKEDALAIVFGDGSRADDYHAR